MPMKVYRTAQVVDHHRASYDDYLELRRGQTVELGDSDSRWTGYIWCTDEAGQGGWVPKAFLRPAAGDAQLLRDYSSRELTVGPGEQVTVSEEAGGWYWAENSEGAAGWLPVEVLAIASIPTMETERLTLRPFTLHDAPLLRHLMSGEAVLRYFPSQAIPSLSRVEDSISRTLDHWQHRGYGVWAATLKVSGELIGRCGLQYLAETEGVEVDYLLGNAYWGQGYATEAASASLEFGFDTLGLARIDGIVHVDNVASRRVLEKVGMKRARQATFFGIPCYHYAIHRAARPG